MFVYTKNVWRINSAKVLRLPYESKLTGITPGCVCAFWEEAADMRHIVAVLIAEPRLISWTKMVIAENCRGCTRCVRFSETWHKPKTYCSLPRL